MLLLALSLACRPAAPPQAPVTPPPPGPVGEPMGPGTTPPPPPMPGSDAPAVQTWTSASCHDRGYERRLTLTPDFNYSGLDLVSPCPPDVQCIWSGVVSYSGTWAQGDDGLITLTESEALQGDKGLPRPKTLRLGEGGALIEEHTDGDCAYVPLKAEAIELPSTELPSAEQGEL